MAGDGRALLAVDQDKRDAPLLVEVALDREFPAPGRRGRRRRCCREVRRESQVRTLAKSTNLLSLLSLLTVLFGFAVMGTSDPKFDLSVTTPWILWSIIAYVIALGVLHR